MEHGKSQIVAFLSFLLIVALLIIGCPAKSSSVPTHPNYNVSEPENFKTIEIGFNSITSQEVQEFIRFLAGPELKGRLSGTKTNLITGEFLAKELESYGFVPLNINEGFYQIFQLDPYDRDWFSKYMMKESGMDPEQLNQETIAEIFNDKSRNVIGILEGTDLKDEYVIFCAHYDHLGLWNNLLYAGADDNGSGTAALLEIAEAFGLLAKEGIKPRRSIIVAFFDAEEFGMIGSGVFVWRSQKSFLKNIAVVLNLDMIGRNDAQELQIIGSQITEEFPQRSPDLYNAVSSANKILGFNLIYPQSFATSHRRYIINLSDQASFRERGIKTVIFLHSGLHKDYHKPTDTAEKIDNEKVQNVAKLVFLTGWQIANDFQKPTYFDGEISK